MRLLDRSGTGLADVVSDTAGRFRVIAPRPGVYRLHVSALGYQGMETTELKLDSRVELQLEVRLSASAVPVEPLRVVARRNYTAMRHKEFYKRADWSGKTGFGDILRYDDIERMRAPTVERLLNSKALDAVGYTGDKRLVSRSTCELALFLDDAAVSFEELNTVLPEHIEGVEMYKNGFDIPPEYLNRTPCGLVLVWTWRHGGSGLTWTKLAIGLGFATGILLLSSGFSSY